MMRISIKSQIEFIEQQIKEHEKKFRIYLNTPMNQHFKRKSAFKAKIWGIDEKRGTVILQFTRSFTPRLKTLYAGFLFNGISDPENTDNWQFSYKFFRETYTKASTSLTPVFYLKNPDTQYRYIGCKDFDNDLFENIKVRLSKGQNPSIVLADSDPPVEYLLNLKNFLESYPTDTVLNMPFEKSIEDWEPALFEKNDSKKELILTRLGTSGEVIVQGPPGTGKSHLIAEIVDDYLGKGKSVCITAQANKALMEVAEKPGIKKWVNEGVVYKTNLNFDEKRKLSQLNKAQELMVAGGELVIASYYKLSGWFNTRSTENNRKVINQVYDLIIIEEASQSFLATIAAFKKLGKAVLIVGDPRQLPPIVLNETEATQIDGNISKFSRGLESYASNSGVNSYLLTTSYRLSTHAANLTGLFYKNLLTSAQGTSTTLLTSPGFQPYIPFNGGTMLLNMPIIDKGNAPQAAIRFIISLVNELTKNNPNLDIAVLAPFRKTVLSLQDQLSESIDDYSNLTIETIDRIQGLTVDFTIFLLTLTNPSFALNLNRFNVATSRATSGTLIITDTNISLFRGIDPLVTAYLKSLPTVNFDTNAWP